MNLKIEQLKKFYHGKEILKDVSMACENIQVLALLGASGSGKSTLLRLIAGLESFEEGDIIVNGTSVKNNQTEAYRKKIGFVFQDHNLFSHLSIENNIFLVLEKVHGRKRHAVKERVYALMDQFGILEHAHKLPHQISGGQSQRASIVRALAIEPDLILLDEPTSSLDPVLTYEVLSAVKKLAEKRVDFVIVTHEIGFAKQVADQIVFMDEGCIIERGSAHILEHPKSSELQNFLEKVLTFEANIVEKG